MNFRKFHIYLNNGLLTIGIDKRSENKPKFYIHDRGGRVNFDLNEFDDTIKILEQLGSIENLKEQENHISLNEYVKFHRSFISDTSKSYNYEFRISEKDKRRNVSSGVYLYGIEQLNLAKESLTKLYNKYINEVWLDEKIQSESLKYVEFNGKKIELEKKYGRLNLANLGIKKISDIKGLKDIHYIKILQLHNNEIEEIEGLDHLKYLRELGLARNNIKEIKRLDKLENLEKLNLSFNPISTIEALEGLTHLSSIHRLLIDGTQLPKDLFIKAGVKDLENAQDLIKYLKERKKKAKDYEGVKSKTIEYIKKASSVYDELLFSKIRSKTGIEIQDLEEIVEDMIFSGQINAKIRKDGIAFIEENPLIGIALETVDVLHEIKDDTELISQYTSYIEDVFDKTENIEEYLRTHLGSEFEKIQNAWQDYKAGKIERKELIKRGIKEIGKTFVKIFIAKI